MPLLGKQVISTFLRTDCQRRLRLDLSPDTQYQLPNGQTLAQERAALGLPPRNVVRPGLQSLTAAGQAWEEEKINDIVRTLGLGVLVGVPTQTPASTYKFSEVPLIDVIHYATPGQFLVQAQFDIGSTFQNSLNINNFIQTYNLAYRSLRPDLIQLVAPTSAQRQAVTPEGGVVGVPVGDERTALRVIDIKLTAEPSVPYYIEVTFYSMALAGWLVDQGLDNQFYVLPLPTVWPGSHDASAMVKLQTSRAAQGTTPTHAEFMQALEEDLEVGEFGVFAPRLRRFFQNELPTVLNANWQHLPWHVDNRCAGCEYLGYRWSGTTPNPDHCWPMAASLDHLSRVAFVSRGARGALEDHHIADVPSLAHTASTDPAYDSHHTLRATRTVVASRAQSLTSGQTSIPPQAGTSAVMPAWADLRIYLTADFDIGSGITIAFGFQAVWAVSAKKIPAPNHYKRFKSQAFPVDQRSLQFEERALGHLLTAIDQAAQHATSQDPKATIQVYLWDALTYDHLVRVIGRHLQTFIQNRTLRRLAWLFPPDSLVPNPELSDRKCPITIVRDVVRAVVAAPIPHYYSLLNVAREYHSSYTPSPQNQFHVPNLFEDPLSDQVPSERAHGIWSRSGGQYPWNQQLQDLERTVHVRLSALESVAQRLADDLQGQLNQTAPHIKDLSPPSLPQKMADDARLWFIFSQLNIALAKLEIQKIHAMPPHEREARSKSAHLICRLSAHQAQSALTTFGLTPASHRHVYEMGPCSTEVRAREGDFSFAVAPFHQPGFLERELRAIAGHANLHFAPGQNEFIQMQWVTQVTVRALDRDSKLIVLDFDSAWWPIIASLETAGCLNLAQDVIMDPIHKDFLISRLKNTLNAIGNPPIAVANTIMAVTNATGSTRQPSRGTPSPSGDLFWNATQLYTDHVQRCLIPVRQLLQQNGHNLNASQWQAWEEALTHRLRLIWGPPGTGKSRTLRTIILGAVHEASQQRRPLRVLITGPTYESIDNVVLAVHDALSNGSMALASVHVARVRSATRPIGQGVPPAIDVITGSAACQSLEDRLKKNREIIIVAATAQQAHKLLVALGGAAQPTFDLILVDEASQLDVATATLPLAGLASGGSVVVAGDPMQLPPIHQAEPPKDLEYMVGPVFSYFKERFHLQPNVLEINYRSCQAIVELAHVAGYPPTLSAHSPNLRLDLTTQSPVTTNPPPNWPPNLFWTPEWSAFLDSDQRAVCFVYDEGRSSQWNQFEADAISSLTWLLHDRMGNQPQNELNLANAPMPISGSLYSPQDFWARGIGVVTPHRAQQALVVSRLHSIFQAQGTQGIREAVDTVERFQGQQRDVMLATFALGDPDAISDEDEFLLSLNRFNVMASRARAKLVVFVSQEVVNHLSSDMDVLRGSALLKTFVESFCSQSQPMQLGYIRNGTNQLVNGIFRWRP